VVLDIAKYPENVQAAILGTAALKLQDLGYTVNTYRNVANAPCLGVS
jgi:hypothetical protein